MDRPTTWPRVLYIALLLISRSLSSAQEDVDRPELDTSFRYDRASKVRSYGSATVSDSSIGFDMTIPVAGSEERGVETDVIGEVRNYNFAGLPKAIFAGTVMRESSALGIEFTGVASVSKSVYIVAEGALGFDAARGAPLSDSFGETVAPGVYWQMDAAKRIGVALEVDRRSDGHKLLIPYPIIDWQVSQSIHVVSTNGNDGRLVYDVAPRFAVLAMLEFESATVRLPRSHTDGLGVLRQESVPLSVGAQFRVSRHFVLTVRGGEQLDETTRIMFHAKQTEMRLTCPYFSVFECDSTF